jgi:AbrB family looped-hinge helix DNA binding protein
LVRIEFERKVGPKGQVVIPKEIRRIMGISPNSKVLISVEDKSVIIKKESNEPVWQFMRKFAKEYGKRLSVKELSKMKEEHYREELGETASALSR